MTLSSRLSNSYDVRVHVYVVFCWLQYRGLAPMYYRGAAAAILVYDITSQVNAVMLYLSFADVLHQVELLGGDWAGGEMAWSLY